MLSLIMLTNKVVEDLPTRQQAIIGLLETYKIKYSVTFISNTDYNALQDVKNVVAQNEKYNLIVLNENTNKNSQIYVALDSTKADNALILDIDTNIDVIEKVLQKYKDDCQNVFVRKKANPLHYFFTKIGMFTYGLGLKMLKKLPDLCCESCVILLNQETINTILEHPQHIKEILNTNLTPDQRYAIIPEKKIYDTPTRLQQKRQKPLMLLGVLSLVFLLVTIAAMLIYPMFNGWIYSLWMFITIVVWLVLSAAACVLIAKQIFNARQGEPIPLDIDDLPLIHVNAEFTHSDLYQQQMYAQFNEESKKEPKAKKEKKTKTEKPKKQTTKKAKGSTKVKSVKTSKTTTKSTKTKAASKETTSTTPKKRGRPPKNKNN